MGHAIIVKKINNMTHHHLAGYFFFQQCRLPSYSNGPPQKAIYCLNDTFFLYFIWILSFITNTANYFIVSISCVKELSSSPCQCLYFFSALNYLWMECFPLLLFCLSIFFLSAFLRIKPILIGPICYPSGTALIHACI